MTPLNLLLTDESGDPEVLTVTAPGENGAAGDIAAGLADTSSDNYAFSANNGVLTITRSDGVNFAIATGVAIGDGDAASDAVDQTTNGTFGEVKMMLVT